MDTQIKILIPLYNDWDSLYLLLKRIETCVPPDLFKRFSFLIINDCSQTDCDPSKIFNSIDLQIVNLNRNIGHQRAIAIGLSYLSDHPTYSQVIVMDSDGEDRPEDIETMLAAAEQHKGKIVFASRLKRHEGFTFRFFYKIYKFVFQMLTGKTIAFGNYCVIPAALIAKLAHVSEIWNHFSGAVIRSKLPYSAIPLNRGRRLAGESKMNFTSLILHGLGAVSVHLDQVAVRLLLFFIGLITLAIFGIITAFGVRFFTNFPISELTSSLILALMIILVQAFMVCLFLVFMVLTYRTHIHFIPALGYKDFILSVERVQGEVD
ncbi:MAG: glycosyltransferase [Spirosomataceae bacterium]